MSTQTMDTSMSLQFTKTQVFKQKLKPYILDVITFAYLLCVVIVAIYAPTEDELLNIQRNGLVVSIALLIGFGITATLDRLNIKTLGAHIFQPVHLKNKEKVQSMMKTFWGWQTVIAFTVTFIIGIGVTKFSFYELADERGIAGAQKIFSALLHPNMQILPNGILAIIETIFMAFMATVIAIPFAFVLSFLAAKNIMGKHPATFAFYVLLRTAFNVSRSIEPLIWAIIFSVWVGIGPFAGMLALMLHSVASLTKQYSEIIEVVNDGPIEGIQSTGANVIQTVWFGIVPQIILPVISFTIYRWDINVRMATIIGLVGGGGIGTLLIMFQGQAMWSEVGTLALLIVIVVWAMDTASAYIREALK